VISEISETKGGVEEKLVIRREKKDTIVITGATGSIGKEVIKRLSTRVTKDHSIYATIDTRCNGSTLV
jgi:FlaA1/EpsC-like NDP-sugar epimerase